MFFEVLYYSVTINKQFPPEVYKCMIIFLNETLYFWRHSFRSITRIYHHCIKFLFENKFIKCYFIEKLTETSLIFSIKS